MYYTIYSYITFSVGCLSPLECKPNEVHCCIPVTHAWLTISLQHVFGDGFMRHRPGQGPGGGREDGVCVCCLSSTSQIDLRVPRLEAQL